MIAEFISQTGIVGLAALAFGGSIFGFYVIPIIVLLPPMLVIDWTSRALGYGRVFR